MQNHDFLPKLKIDRGNIAKILISATRKDAVALDKFLLCVIILKKGKWR